MPIRWFYGIYEGTTVFVFPKYKTTVTRTDTVYALQTLQVFLSMMTIPPRPLPVPVPSEFFFFLKSVEHKILFLISFLTFFIYLVLDFLFFHLELLVR